MSMRDLLDGEAELDDEENDDSFDEETGEARPRKERQNGDMEDSSEEEDDDDDEEAARAVREGFIIDDDEEPEEQERRRKKDRKRRRAEREEEEAVLDEEDLDLIGEANPEWERKTTTQQKFKRLKRGHRDDDDEHRERGLAEIFSDDEEQEAPYDMERQFGRPDHHRVDEFADFIEEDDLEDETEKQALKEKMEVAAPRERGYIVGTDATGLDQDTLDDMEAIFGNGEDYDWALAREDEEEAMQAGDHNLELKDVFEPSQLAEKLLTDEDNQIRWADEPERFQLDRKLYKHVQITDEQFKEEARWITSLIWPKKQLHGDLKAPFTRAIGKVLEFFVVDEVEVPYVFQHRKDYLIHAKKTRAPADLNNPDAPEYVVSAEKLLNQDDLWRILELDLKFRALIDKRNALEKTYDNLKLAGGVEDKIFEAMLPVAATMEELQDIQDYIYFQYSAQLKDLAATNGDVGQKRRPGNKTSIFDRVRKGKAYNLVRAYGITADQVAQNALRQGRKQYTEDSSTNPIDLADSLTSESEFSTGEQVLLAARQMFAEELFMNPRMREHFRMNYYRMGLVDCRRTEKGLRKIDENHQYYELKYLKSQTFGDIASKPEMFLKMLKAEEEGLLDVRVTLQNERDFRKQLFAEFASDNFSELADAWNEERRKVLEIAFAKLERVITKGVKESMRTECQDSILKICRDEYSKKLDQAPYKPKGMVLGTIPRVLTLSNGKGDLNRDPVYWAWVEEDGRVLENGKFNRLLRDDKARDGLVELIQRRKPDVIGVSGFSVDTQKLVATLRDLVADKNLRGADFEDPETGDDRSEPLEIVVVNDEVARLYKDTSRATVDHPGVASLTRYCIALAKYLQNPMKEYAALGNDVVSLSFHPCQQLLPEDKLRKQLETAMVDMVNLCGVDINEAIGDSYTATLLPFVCGLGPRKATAVLKTINANGGLVNTRDELVGDPDSGKLPVVGPRVWNNCASFLSIEYDSSTPTSDYLDNTRVHPEDYELGRKMAADALELDEEDVKAEVDEGGAGAIVRKLIKEEEQEKVNDLILEEYAEQLERNYNQRKRATLETIRAELQQPYEELRRNFTPLSDEEIFTMLTGETRESLCEGMIVSVNIRIVKEDFIVAKLDSGLEGRVEPNEGSDDPNVLLNRLFSVGQTAQAKLLELDRKNFAAKLSLREEAIRAPYRKRVDHDPSSWDTLQELKDKEELREKDKATGRIQRVVKHPLFKPFNSTQAEEYLGSQGPGDAVIRPSSKGNDHLAVTWKVADGVYQHIDVLELQKDNEFSVGRQLRIAGKYNYSDLDELINDHVKAMAKKVDEMMQHEKYQSSSKADTERWLTTYTEANPKRSVYAFCLDTKHPGHFFLCFKAGQLARVNSWPVKIIPNAYELMKSQYPDIKALSNGFKLHHAKEMTRRGIMAGLEQLEIHSKSYIVRWVKVDEGHTISWSVQPHKKSINFGIVKHPGTSNTTTPLPQHPVLEDATSALKNLDVSFDKQRRASTARNETSTAQEQLRAKGFIPIQWYGKCDADKVSMDTYPVAAGCGGMYGLVFDNTFSIHLSKTATFVLLTYPTNAPPHSTHHLQNHQGSLVGTGISSIGKAHSPKLGATASESVESLQSHLASGRNGSTTNSVAGGRNGSESTLVTYHVGVLQKRRRKRGQGYARRFFSLDFASCTLSYYYNRNSSALRGAIPLSLAAIAADERRREISIDSGAEVWHLKANNAKEFTEWTRALEKASNAARGIEAGEPPSPDRLKVRTTGFKNTPVNQEEEREWEQVAALVSRIVGTRDAVRRLSKDTAPKTKAKSYGLSSRSNPPTEDSADYFGPAPEKRPFWKRKSSTPQSSQTFQRSISSQLAVPSPATTTTVTAAISPSRKSKHEESSMHDHCTALLNDLDAVLLDFSTLLANSKRRRSATPHSATRYSMDSVSTGEFYDAESDRQDHSQLIIIERRSEEDGHASEGEDEFVNDTSSLSSAEEDENSSHVNGATALFPTKPKSLDPLPLKNTPKRRKVIPAATTLPPSLIGFLRKNVGKDLSTITMPVSANEPVSLVQRVAEQLEYADILGKAATQKAPTQRLLYIAAFAISQFSSSRARERAIRKPFNSLLGETYELVRGDNEVPGGFRIIVEKVCHRPVRLACQADSANWSFNQSSAPTQKFWGKSAELITEGRSRLVLRLTDGSEEYYSWNTATVFLRNVVMGEKYVEPVGTMAVVNETTGSKASIEFKQKGMFGGRSEDVQVDTFDPNGTPSGTGLIGTWTSGLQIHESGKSSGVEIWHVGELVEDAPQRYGLTTFAASLNEITEVERGKLPPTDSRLRPDQRAAEAGDLDTAETWKTRLEEKQRFRRKILEGRGEEYKPRWFVKVEGGDEGEEVWKLKGSKEGYWEERAKGSWTGIEDILAG